MILYCPVWLILMFHSDTRVVLRQRRAQTTITANQFRRNLASLAKNQALMTHPRICFSEKFHAWSHSATIQTVPALRGLAEEAEKNSFS